LVLFSVASDRPGIAGKATMPTYIQIDAAKPRAKAHPHGPMFAEELQKLGCSSRFSSHFFEQALASKI